MEVSSRTSSFPSTLHSLHDETRNTAPETRARYRYQDECTALAAIRHLDSPDLEGIVVELSTDLTLIPKIGLPELVSIKHREPSQSGTESWSFSALRKQNVLNDLFRIWTQNNRQCTLAFWSNSGFAGTTYDLWRACALRQDPTSKLLSTLAKELACTTAEAAEFVNALSIPADPLPRRKEITDVGIRRMAEMLKKYRAVTVSQAEDCYWTLVAKIANAGTDVPENEATPGPTVAATLADVAANRDSVKRQRRYIDVAKTMGELVYLRDCIEADNSSDIDSSNWEPDAYFTGRSTYLDLLGQLLHPRQPEAVAPVVVHGMPGCGKTSLVAQFAALNKNTFKAIFINAATRENVIDKLADLTEDNQSTTWSAGITDIRGPFTPVLPGNSATLLILDGVTDSNTLRGLIPRSSICRVLITSTVPFIDQGHEHVELSCWSREESRSFLAISAPNTSEDDRNRLATALFDHPLALTQAVSYCNATGRTVDEYIVRLQSEPRNALMLGQASGHLNSVASTIGLSLEAADERWPNCSHILKILSYLGGGPFDPSIFDGDIITACVASPVLIEHNGRGLWNRIRRGLGYREVISSLPITPHARNVLHFVRDQQWRQSAIDALLMTSLLRMSGSKLSVHPLIATVVRGLEGNPLPWLEIGIGLFWDAIQGIRNDHTAVDQHISDFSALATMALSKGHDGPAVMAICHYLSERVRFAPGSENDKDRGLTAVEFGQQAVRIAERYVGANVSAGHLVMTRIALARAFWAAGHPDLALTELERNLRLGHELQDREVILGSLVGMSSLAWSASVTTELSRRVLSELSEYSVGVSEDRYARIMIEYGRARIYWLLGSTNEASSCIQFAMNLAEPEGSCGTEFKIELHHTAAHLARYRGDIKQAFTCEKKALRFARSYSSKGLDATLLDALILAADMAIDARESAEARLLLDEASDLAHALFGEQSFSCGRVMAVEGRLSLVECKWTDAQVQLQRALEMMRSDSSVDRAYLSAPLLHLAQVTLVVGDRNASLEYAREAYDVDCQIYGAEHPEAHASKTVLEAVDVVATLLEECE